MKAMAIPALCTVLMAVAVGCSEDAAGPAPESEGLQVGTFTATISGSMLSGVAASRTSTSQPGHVLQLTATGGQSINIATPVGERPTSRDYPIVLLEDAEVGTTAGVYGGIAAMPPSLFTSVSGTLTISSSSDTEVRGSFSFTAVNDLAPGGSVTIEGSFAASHRTL